MCIMYVIYEEIFFWKNRTYLKTYTLPYIVSVFCLPKTHWQYLADFTPHSGT